MAYGMTPEQFWDGDCEMYKYYRAAYELRRQLKSEEMWIQGAYIADAVASALYGKKAPYPKKPYPLTKAAEKAQKEEERRISDIQTTGWLDAWAERANQNIRKKERQKQQEGNP